MNMDELLRTRVDSEDVVCFIEGLVQSMGSAASGQNPQQPVHRGHVEHGKKYQSKSVAAIMQKLERVKKYPDLAQQVIEDASVLEWVNRTGCKQKEYFDELECAQELTGFFGGHRQFELAVKAANKALTITLLHRREDEETLAELQWVLAELHAASDNMEMAVVHMRKCLALTEPEAGEDHPTYKELLSQLEETRQRCTIVAVS